MDGIAVNVVMLLLKGIPEGLLTAFALHIFTRTRIDFKKYLFLSFVYIAATYLIRLLPITLGVNTVLTLLVLIIFFQFTYKYQLSKVVRSVISAILIVVIIAISEVLNMLILTILFGTTKAEALFNSSNGLEQSISTFPSTFFTGLLIFIGYLVIRRLDKRKIVNGEVSKETGL